MKEMESIFKSRPFKVRNADEYDLQNILNLFVSPIDGLSTPFDYENTIIKGRMGSGKTMYLRANHAYYLYGLVPSLIEQNAEVILPVLIRLSDFQHIKKPEEIYRSIIIKIIEELTSIYLHLQDSKKLASLHSGIKFLPDDIMDVHKLSSAMRTLSQLGADEYIERVTNELGASGSLKPSFFEISATWKESKLTEIKKKANPGIKDIQECYKNLLADQDGKILLLIDEAGSLDKRFFSSDSESESSFFEILMNQFRSADYIRTKIAVYPNSYSDILTETRYGDTVSLEEYIADERSYDNFRKRAINIIQNYLNPSHYEERKIEASQVFEISETQYGDCIEQLLYGSNGNMRRLIHLLDIVLGVTYRNTPKKLKVTATHAIEALKEHSRTMEQLFSSNELSLLSDIVSVCKSRGTYKFKFPGMAPTLYKYTGKSQEYNIIKIEELGIGSKSSTYSFDYCFAVCKEIPTHYMSGTERVNRDRTLAQGPWIGKITKINAELIEQASLPGKIEGSFYFYDAKREIGFIKSETENQYFFDLSYIIQADKDKIIRTGKRVRFYPETIGHTKVATNIEIL